MRIATLVPTLILSSAALANLDAYVNYAVSPFCGYSNGSISIGVSGGTGPYSFAWDDGPVTQNRSDLPAGTYTITVTDALAATDVEVVTLIDQPDMGYIFITTFIIDGGGFHPCPGQCNAQLKACVSCLQGVPPYTVNMDTMGWQVPQLGTDQLGDPYFGTFCVDDQVTVYVQDANGCTGQETRTIEGPMGLPIDVVGVAGACNAVANGSALLDIPVDIGGWTPTVDVQDALGTTVYAVDFVTGPITVPNLAAGDYTVYQSWNAVVVGCVQIAATFTIPDLGASCGDVSGTLFIDHNQNCVQDVVDIPVPTRLVQIDPGPTYALTDPTGHYSANLVYGSYTATVIGSDLLQICPVQTPAPFDITAVVPSVALDLADSSTVPLDIGLELGTGAAHPGFAFLYSALVKNTTAALSGPLTVTLTFDPVLSFTSASPTPTSVVGNVVTWNEPALLSYSNESFHVQTQIPANPGLIGTYLVGSINVSQTQTESDLGNNTGSFQRLVTGSFDPNDKLVEPHDVFLLDVDDYLSYTIDFQNTGTDTAFTVVVVDSLSTDVDPASIVFGASSHDYVASVEGSGIVRFTFNNILLPDSSVNESASRGFVCFRIKPRADLLAGTFISNEADILFDFNDPVRTNAAVVEAEFTTSLSSAQDGSMRDVEVFPNPARDHIKVRASSGTIRRVELLSADGRQLSVRTNSNDQCDMDIAQFAAGSYSIVVLLQDGTRSHLRFVKQ